MATYLELVQALLLYTEKIQYNEAENGQVAQALRDLNDAVRLVYNHGDLSFKTGIKRGFVYSAPTPTPSAPARGVPLPSDFLGFHQTGKVYLENDRERGSLVYLSYQKIMDRTEGFLSSRRGIPTHYGLGGPSKTDTALNQRELLLWPTPSPNPVTLTLVYQVTPPPDIADISAANVEIPRIPKAWHYPVVLAVAKQLRKIDKGADDSAYTKLAVTAIQQMSVQEPHGREKPSVKQIHPAWRAR